MERPGGLSAIGDTPVVRLARMAGDDCAEVWVKLEAAREAARDEGIFSGPSTGANLAAARDIAGRLLRLAVAVVDISRSSAGRHLFTRVLPGRSVVCPAPLPLACLLEHRRPVAVGVRSPARVRPGPGCAGTLGG